MVRAFDPAKVPQPPGFRPFAVDWSQAVDIEIGCGVGFHPLQYARAHPERQLIAFERTKDKFAKFAGRLAHHPPLPNLLPVHGDAIAWITHGVPPESVSKYFLLYPNPYPKESQRNLRFHQMPFFAYLLRTLKPGGLLTLATNEEFYRNEAREMLVGKWGLLLEREEILSATALPRTHFEKKYLARGERCWNLLCRRPSKS